VRSLDCPEFRSVQNFGPQNFGPSRISVQNFAAQISASSAELAMSEACLTLNLWTPFGLDRRESMIFDDAPQVQSDARGQERKLLAPIPYVRPGT
jgi:hypothetical protein